MGKQAIMKIELNSEDGEFKVLEFISIIKEVTDDLEYKNYQMAKCMPKE